MNNRNLPYNCIKDSSKITHSIIHENKYTSKFKTQSTYLLEGTHTPKQSTLPVTLAQTLRNSQPYHLHSSTYYALAGQVFSTDKKSKLVKFIPNRQNTYA